MYVSECPVGETCFNDSVFHYRDYAHKVLAHIRASKGHLPHECLHYTALEKVNKMGHKNKQLSSPLNPLTSNKSAKRTPSNDVGWHLPAHRKKLFSDVGQPHTTRRDDCNDILLRNCDIYQTCGEGAARIKEEKKEEMKSVSINGEKDTAPDERISKDLKFCVENLKSAVVNGISEGSSSNILTAIDHNCKRNKNNFEEQTCADCHNCDCNHELKLEAVVECTADKVDTRCGENSSIRTCVLPCKVESDSECLREVKATMSVVLSQSKQSSVNGETKLKTPVKVDASCSEVGWETVGIAAMPDAEVSDVMLSLCKCSKTVQINCSLLQKHTLTNSSNKRVVKKRKLESKFFSNIRELKLLHDNCKKEIAEIPHHQMSVTTYFQSSRSPKSPADGGTKDVKRTSSTIAASQDSHCFKSCDMNTAKKEYVGNSCEAPKESKCLKHTCFLFFFLYFPSPLSLYSFVILACVTDLPWKEQTLLWT
jgi:hypothetical protein